MAVIKFVLLVPLNYNDGSEVAPEVREKILDDLFLLAGGYTVAGTVTGAYRMRDGSRQVDQSLQVWVGVGAEEVGQLKTLVARFAALLGQESMYLERSGGTIEFIAPPEQDHEREAPEGS